MSVESQFKEQLDRIERNQIRIDKKLTALLTTKKETWLSALDIIKLTGWNKDDLYRMRRNGVVVFKKNGGSIMYKLESVPEIYLTKKETV